MAGNKSKRTLAYPGHVLQPTDLLHFIYLDGFESDCQQMGIREGDLEAMEIFIMAGGKDSPVIQGTGGLRKMRFAPEIMEARKEQCGQSLFRVFSEVLDRVDGDCLQKERIRQSFHIGKEGHSPSHSRGGRSFAGTANDPLAGKIKT